MLEENVFFLLSSSLHGIYFLLTDRNIINTNSITQLKLRASRTPTQLKDQLDESIAYVKAGFSLKENCVCGAELVSILIQSLKLGVRLF